MANEVRHYFEGFVFRGRPAGSAEPSSWHVEVGRYIDVEGVGRTPLPTLVLTPEQAEAAGFPLSTVIAEINGTVMAERDAAVAALAALQMEADDMRTRIRLMTFEPARSAI